jgi:hypothetical protein
MVCEKDERLAVAVAKERLLAKAGEASIAAWTRANPAEAVFTAFAAGLALGARRETFANFLKAATLVKELSGKQCR